MKKALIILIVTILIISLFMPVAFAKAKERSFSAADINLLIRVVYAEARGECYLGMVAVACVAINRAVAHPDLPMTYITRHGQFAKAGTWILKSKSPGTKVIVSKIREAVLFAIKYRPLPSNCMNFKRANRPTWSSHGAGRKIIRYCAIGHHTFYTCGAAKPVLGPVYIDRYGRLVER